MILSGSAITSNVTTKRIVIEPFVPECVNPNSYNYHLGSELIIFDSGEVKPGGPYRRIQIPATGYVLQPGHLYLGQTQEKLGSSYYVTSLIGRSTLGRLGVWLQVTADLGHVGATHHWTLEMKVALPIRIYAGMPIGQVSFWRITGTAQHKYKGRYAADIQPVTSRL